MKGDFKLPPEEQLDLFDKTEEPQVLEKVMKTPIKRVFDEKFMEETFGEGKKRQAESVDSELKKPPGAKDKKRQRLAEAEVDLGWARHYYNNR